MKRRSSLSDTTRSVLTIGAITIATKCLGFVEKLLLAYFFGTGTIVEAYIVAVTGATVIFLLVREIVEPSFLPLFVQLRAQNENRAARGLVKVLALLILGAGGLLVGFALVDPTRVGFMLAPGLGPETLALTATMLRWTLPASILLALSAVTYLTLNALGRFALPAGSDLGYKLALTLGVLVAGATSWGPLGLAVSFVLASGLRLGTHLCGLRSWIVQAQVGSTARARDIRVLASLAAPVVIGALLAQLGDLADNWYASIVGPGAISARSYASKVVDLPVVVLPYAMSIVLFPRLSRLYAEGREHEFYAVLYGSLRGLLCLFLPIAVCSALLAEPIVALVFQRGAFDRAARELTSSALSVYSIGLPIFALEALIVPAFFARQRPAIPVLLGMGSVGLSLSMMWLFVPSLGIRALAGSLVFAKFLKLVVLVALLRRWRPLKLGREASLPAWALVIPTVFSATCGIAAIRAMGGWKLDSIAERGLYCLAAAAVILTAFFAAALVLPGPGRACVVALLTTRGSEEEKAL